MVTAVIRFLCLAGLGLTAGACATIANGTTQAINIDSEPAGAECTLMRAGQPISAVTTPAPVTVKRDQQTIHVRCKKDGYEEALVVMNSRYETASAGNILLGGVIGMMIDNSSGANAKYDPYVMVRMTALSPADQAAAAARAKAAAQEQPVQIAAAAPNTIDGTYTGGVELSQSFLGRYAGVMRRFEVKLADGIGKGTSRNAKCSGPGEVELTVDAQGAVKGTANVQNAVSCAALPVQLDGRLQNQRLHLSFRTGEGQLLEFDLMRSSP